MTENPNQGDSSRLERAQGYNPYIDRYLSGFKKYFDLYADEGLIEVCVNRPGEIWIETHEKGWRQIEDPALSEQELNRFATNLAKHRMQHYDRDKMPFLFTSLPNWGFRVAIAGRGVVESGIAISIRIARAKKFPLESYFQDTCQISKVEIKSKKSSNIQSTEDLIAAVRDGANILVAGSTGSGKTTFINGLMDYIPQESRVIVIEDTAEIQIPHPNHVRLLKSKTGTDLAGVGYKDLINICMRLRPDRLILGELDTDNVVPFLRLLNTGHGGSISSIHVEEPSLVPVALEQNASMAGGALRKGAVEDFAREVIKDVIFLEGNGRCGVKAYHEYIG